MSRHHVGQQWSTFSRIRRAELLRLLPLPCIECGKAVLPDPPRPPGVTHWPTTWHVGHLQDAAKGGRPTRENTGPIHAACNLRSGGKAGAAHTNAQRAAGDGIRPW